MIGSSAGLPEPKHHRVRWQVATRSSCREINELAPLISARAVSHAGSLWGYITFADADNFVTARAYLVGSLLFYLFHGFRVALAP